MQNGECKMQNEVRRSLGGRGCLAGMRGKFSQQRGQLAARRGKLSQQRG